MATKLPDLSRSLNLAFGPAWPGRLPRGFAMTDPARTPDPAGLVAALPGGVGLIFRHYGHPDRGALARAAVEAARRRGVAILIADDWDLALRLGADGVHLPEYRLRRPGAARAARRGPDWLVTAAAHGPRALARARACGVDAALLSPVFATESHDDRRPLGVARFAGLCRAAGLPIYGLGGISAANLRRLAVAGAAGIAGIGIFDPRGVR